MRFQYLAFDIDGTLFSSEGIILDTYAEAVQDYIDRSGSQIIVPSQERIMKEIGKPVKTIFRNLLPELDEVSRDSISDRVLGLLVKKIESGEGSYYTDSKETIQILAESGYKMLACSNGRLPYIDVILRKLGVRDLFLPICTIDNLTKKEKGDILLQYCQDYNISPQSILMIGDRYSDWEAAQKSKSPFAFCKYGHAEENEIPNFEFLLQNVGDLKKILLPG